DLGTVYSVPKLLHDQGITDHVRKRLGLPGGPTDLVKWNEFVTKIETANETVRIALVGKYTGLKDSYISHYKAFEHSGAHAGVNVEVVWINAPEGGSSWDADLEKMQEELSRCDGVLVPGGFGIRGTEGKIEAIKYARENNIPFLGICLGLQLAVIEFARNVMKLEGANSTEFNEDTEYPIVAILPEQLRITQMGATMRLGEQKAILNENSLAFKLYGKKEILERHRHRFEINPEWIERIEEHGWVFSARSEDKIKMEIGELPLNDYHIGCQFHPEFLSHPETPAPLFKGLVEAAKDYNRKRR
ncbi:MAG: CTP synthase, partial [Candidatus Thermoplasmatota archaeon]|nr:CTP synthase [Candidatus Thermoplasmatota archaeon]